MAIAQLIVRVDRHRRIKLYPEGGLALECYIEGPGWCVDNDADVSDTVVGAHLADALAILANAAECFGVNK